MLESFRLLEAECFCFEGFKEQKQTWGRFAEPFQNQEGRTEPFHAQQLGTLGFSTEHEDRLATRQHSRAQKKQVFARVSMFAFLDFDHL